VRDTLLARFYAWARPYRGSYARGLGWLLATNVLILGIPWLVRDAVHKLQARAPRGAIAADALAIVAVALVQAVVRTQSRLEILGTSRRIAYDAREAFFGKLLTLDARFYDSQRTGDIMSRGINDLQLLQSFYGPGLMNALNTAIVYALTVVVMLRLDALLSLIALSTFPPLYLAVNRLSRRVYARSLAVQEQLAEISSRAQENLSGIQQVRIFGQEEREIAAFRALCDDFRRKSLALSRSRAAMISLIGVFAGLGTLLVLFVGGLHVIRGRITLGDFVAFNAYLGQLAWPTIALGWMVNVFQRAAGAMRRLDEIFLAEPAIPPPEPGEPAPPLPAGDIEIRDLTFAYDSSRERPALSGVTLRIPRGSRVALVGTVGSGKSTLAHLLARVYPAPAGTVFLGGADVTTLPVARVRAAVALVPQEALLFSRTLAENIALGRASASEADIENAARRAALTSEIRALPSGLATVVGERGYTLSGGQRPRATVARALLAEAPVLILDDALSSVDADTERAILSALEADRRERTLILATHRLSTLTAVDRIVVLESGRVVEDGPHDALIARDGVYARLFRRQQLEERLTG